MVPKACFEEDTAACEAPTIGLELSWRAKNV